MDAFRLMFGFGPKKQQQRAPRMQAVNETGTERVMLYDDTSSTAVAARHNMAAIYGAANVPDTFAMRPVVEVKDAAGKWVPVSGQNDATPDVETQIAYLRNYRETGEIGVTPVAPDEIVGQSGALPGAEQVGGGAAGQGGQPQGMQQLSYGTAMPMLQMPAQFALGQPQGQQGQQSGQGQQAGMMQLPPLAMLAVPPGLIAAGQDPQTTAPGSSDEARNVPKKPRDAQAGPQPNTFGGGGLQMFQIPDMLGRGVNLL